MTAATFIVAVLAAVAAAGAWLEVRILTRELEREREPRGLDGRAVLVSTVGSTSVRGIVQADLPDRLTLRSAVVLSVGSDAEAPAGGLIHLMRERIDVVQELSEAAARKEG